MHKRKTWVGREKLKWKWHIYGTELKIHLSLANFLPGLRHSGQNLISLAQWLYFTLRDTFNKSEYSSNQVCWPIQNYVWFLRHGEQNIFVLSEPSISGSPGLLTFLPKGKYIIVEECYHIFHHYLFFFFNKSLSLDNHKYNLKIFFSAASSQRLFSKGK